MKTCARFFFFSHCTCDLSQHSEFDLCLKIQKKIKNTCKFSQGAYSSSNSPKLGLDSSQMWSEGLKEMLTSLGQFNKQKTTIDGATSAAAEASKTTESMELCSATDEGIWRQTTKKYVSNQSGRRRSTGQPVIQKQSSDWWFCLLQSVI